MDPARFLFPAETATATNMARRYGRGPLGARLVAAVPHGHWRTTTFVAGLRQSGIVAPLVLDGPMAGGARLRLALHRARQAHAERPGRQPDRPAT
jgi:hypothetical protein